MAKPKSKQTFKVYVDIMSDNTTPEEPKQTSNDLVDPGTETKKPFQELSLPENSRRDGNPTPPSPSNRTSGVGSNSRNSRPSSKNIHVEHDNLSGENEKHSELLCGYLDKRRVGSKLNQYKRRWFVCYDNTCKLLYYKTQHDVYQLGEIDISNATFTDDLENERKHVLKINSMGSDYLLQAPDKQTMLYWIQELRNKRKDYNKMKQCLAKESLTSKSLQMPQKGLVKGHNTSSLDGTLPNSPKLMSNVQPPLGTVGINSAVGRSPNPAKNFSFGNIRAEMKNLAIRTQIKNSSRPASVAEESDDLTNTDQPLPLRRNHSLKEQASQKLVNLRQKLSPRRPIAFGTLQGHRCTRCREAEETLTRREECIEGLEEDLQAKEEMIRTFQKHISGFMSNIENSGSLEQNGHTPSFHDSHTQSFYDRHTPSIYGNHTQIINDGRTEVSKVEEVEVDQEEKQKKYIDQLLTDISGYKETISMYQDTLKDKDHIVEILTNRLDELERTFVSDKHGSSQSLTDLQNMQDTYEAYRTQNRILSEEILQLGKLREQDEMRERSSKVNYGLLEAEYYCMKSKYLVCLRELNSPKLEGDASESIVSQEIITDLLKEAMDSDAKPAPDRPNIQEHEKYDKYGFWFLSIQASEDINSRADSLQKRSDELHAKMNSIQRDISTHVKWENFMLRMGNRPLERNQELKHLIRSGIPVEYREKVWNFSVQCHLGVDHNIYGDEHYQNLLKKAQGSTSLSPAVTQVELDLLRTLPNNRYFESSSSEGIPKLRNVLLAFSLHNPEIGYCQGLNRLAAIALLFLEEEDAFWCLVAIVEYLMPKDYYTKGLIAAHIDQRVLKDLVAEKAPKVHALLQEQDTDLVLFTFNWFMTLFIDNIPVETYLRIWDTFLFEGSKVLFRFAVAFFLYCEEYLLKANEDNIMLNNCLRSLGEHITDVNLVTQIAFENINPFPIKYINGRRQYHSNVVMADMANIQKMRTSFYETIKVETDAMLEDTTGVPWSPHPHKRTDKYKSLNSDDDIDE